MSKKFASKSGEAASAADEASSYPVLRVLRTGNSGPPPLGLKGYHPATAVNLAATHRWVRYRTFIPFLRRLMMINFHDRSDRSNVQRDVDSLGARAPVPVAVNRRFPDDEVYVCVDRAPVGSLMVRLVASLNERPSVSLQEITSREYYDVVRMMMDVVTGEESTHSSGLPVLYNRCIFESVFDLQWRE